MKHFLLKEIGSGKLKIMHVQDPNCDYSGIALKQGNTIVRELEFENIPRDRKYRHAWVDVSPKKSIDIDPELHKKFMLEQCKSKLIKLAADHNLKMALGEPSRFEELISIYKDLEALDCANKLNNKTVLKQIDDLAGAILNGNN